MKSLKYAVVGCAAVALLVLAAPQAWACAGCGCRAKKTEKAVEKKVSTVTVCVKCGETAGSEKCCAEDAAKCTKCGLHKGAPGCCRIGKDVEGKTVEIEVRATCGAKCGTKCGTKKK